LANVIIGEDTSKGYYQFTAILNTGTNYFLVNTDDRDEFGAFTTIITGAGNVNATSSTSVPEPFTIVGTLVGGSAALRMRKKLKSTTKA
jgi:hypothetical protein